ncbi:hypothetical protein [Marinobacterium stanieri]|uniref:DUF1353 domain-containing protein n=1 Tax=Marinobacterium stanieri TaxID=49186 RepID=A0A1N6Q2I3_9GAMM|nr:hypothetical protein [Marinobacterium stanieri]SIQ10791.1 hypothetical protein SAMN05421647_102208 [Marinobacterium stanieri]
MKYRKRNWKYQLAERAVLQTHIHPPETLETEWITLHPDGTMILAKGYAWDGPSGPTFDTPDSMRGSAIHDALYQLMKLGLLDMKWFKKSNQELLRWLKKDGMWWIRRRAWYRAVQAYGEEYMNRGEDDATIYIAPSGDIYA